MGNTKITATELATLYQNAVQDEVGLLAKIDEDNDIIFKHPDMGTMFFSVDAEKDPEYMMLVFPNFANKDVLGLTREQLLIAINTVNTQNKAVKLGIRADTIGTTCEAIATIECFLAGTNQAPSPELLKSIIKRNLSALRAGVRSLIKEAEAMTEQLSEGAVKQETI
ncbi:MAG: hypothetical protein JWR40_2402 [Massilia sp.]|jgi:hypothetical protein|nr:hypothetical protein [Massilia sp.]MDB5948538.1 hypothetical protein [Massilia sp.]